MTWLRARTHGNVVLERNQEVDTETLVMIAIEKGASSIAEISIDTLLPTDVVLRTVALLLERQRVHVLEHNTSRLEVGITQQNVA